MRALQSGRRHGSALTSVPLSLLVAGLFVATVASMVISVGLGPIGISPAAVARIVAGHLSFGPTIAGSEDFIVWQLRAPRVLQAVAVGAGLALAGLLSQALIRNPLGDPFIFGLSSGSSLGAVLVITTTGAVGLGLVTVPAAAALGALVTALIVFGLSGPAGSVVPGKLVMTGFAVGQLLAGLTSFLLLRTKQPAAQQQVLFWLLGSIAGAQWLLALTCTTVIVVLCFVAAALAGKLNLLVLGDDAAAALGLNASHTRVVLLALITLLTGTVVAVSGIIGFVGLVVPNLARLLVGADHRRCVPVTALLGALLVLWSDTAARLVLAPTELPIGILTAAIGVPFFLLVLRRSATGIAGLA